MLYYFSVGRLKNPITVPTFDGLWSLDPQEMFLAYVGVTDGRKHGKLDLPHISDIRFSAQVIEFDNRLNIRRISNPITHRTL